MNALPKRTEAASADADAALLDLLLLLQRRDWRFVTPTPVTHARVVARRDRAKSLRDLLGWSLPFAPGTIDPEVEALLAAADGLEPTDDRGLTRARFRISSLHGRLFLHSAYPTEAEDSIFFGPDSYRFADLVVAELPNCPSPPGMIVDIGTGAGVGALAAAERCPTARLVMTDVNPKALRLARINAAAAGLSVETVETRGLAAVEGPIEVAIANPPYIVDDAGRAYRDGGGMHGAQLSLDMAREAAARLEPGGRLILYTGAAIVDGRDALREALEPAMAEAGCDLSYRELDPDVFGEELENEAYADVDRIAVIGAVAVKRG